MNRINNMNEWTNAVPLNKLASGPSSGGSSGQSDLLCIFKLFSSEGIMYLFFFTLTDLLSNYFLVLLIFSLLIHSGTCIIFRTFNNLYNECQYLTWLELSPFSFHSYAKMTRDACCRRYFNACFPLFSFFFLFNSRFVILFPLFMEWRVSWLFARLTLMHCKLCIILVKPSRFIPFS